MKVLQILTNAFWNNDQIEIRKIFIYATDYKTWTHLNKARLAKCESKLHHVSIIHWVWPPPPKKNTNNVWSHVTLITMQVKCHRQIEVSIAWKTRKTVFHFPFFLWHRYKCMGNIPSLINQEMQIFHWRCDVSPLFVLKKSLALIIATQSSRKGEKKTFWYIHQKMKKNLYLHSECFRAYILNASDGSSIHSPAILCPLQMMFLYSG